MITIDALGLIRFLAAIGAGWTIASYLRWRIDYGISIPRYLLFSAGFITVAILTLCVKLT